MARALAQTWYVYVARCADGTLYCGIARDVAARIAQHNAGTAAKYTAKRGPVMAVFLRRTRSKGTALRFEYAIKQLTRVQKDALVAEPSRADAIARRLARV